MPKQYNKSVFVILILFAVGGCKSLSQPVRYQPVAAQPSTTVTVKRHLDSAREVAIDGYLSLQQAISAGGLGNEAVLRLARAKADAIGRGDKKSDLKEDIVVLIRDNQLWYFPKAWLATEAVGGMPLKAGDVAISIPRTRCLFFRTRSQDLPDEITVGLFGAEAPFSGSVQLENQRSMGLALVQKLAVPEFKFTRENKTASVVIVRRQVNGKVHNLVMPVLGASEKSQLPRFLAVDTAEILASGNAFLSDGDSVNYTNLALIEAAL